MYYIQTELPERWLVGVIRTTAEKHAADLRRKIAARASFEAPVGKTGKLSTNINVQGTEVVSNMMYSSYVHEGTKRNPRANPFMARAVQAVLIEDARGG